MLSILIPVYNFDITQLVGDLCRQARLCNVPFEVRCYDDGSEEASKALNRAIREHTEVVWEEMPENLGRSAIRNRLAAEAAYPYLLFMDCDSQVVTENFVRNYVDRLTPGTVLYGGRAYLPNPPQNRELYLRWFYGSEREVIPLDTRQKTPYRTFMTNNFLVPREVYQDIRLNEELKGYGHEDTLFGLELKKRKVPIQHLDNPLYHIGLETAPEFLRKTREGVRNLAYLIDRGLVDNEVRLYRFYARLKKMGGLALTRTAFRSSRERVEANLLSDRPSLKRFDFYKLGLLLEHLEK